MPLPQPYCPQQAVRSPYARGVVTLRRCAARGLPRPAALRLNPDYKGYHTHVSLATLPLGRSLPQRLQGSAMPILTSLFGMRRKSDAPPPSSRASAGASPGEITREMCKLTISGRPQAQAQVQVPSHSRPPPQDDNFVGGFRPGMVGGSVPYATPLRSAPTVPSAFTPPHPGPPPVPPKMVITPAGDKGGISRTMEYALSSPGLGVAGPSRPPPNSLQRPALDAPRPRSDPAAYTRPPADNVQPTVPLSLFSDEDDQPPLSVPSRPSSSRASPPGLRVPTSQTRGRSVSSPAVSPSSDLPSKFTCSGFTKAGPRCKRQKNRSALPLNATEWYCPSHLKEALEPDQFPVLGGGFVKYSRSVVFYLVSEHSLNDYHSVHSGVLESSSAVKSTEGDAEEDREGRSPWLHLRPSGRR